MKPGELRSGEAPSDEPWQPQSVEIAPDEDERRAVHLRRAGAPTRRGRSTSRCATRPKPTIRSATSRRRNADADETRPDADDEAGARRRRGRRRRAGARRGRRRSDDDVAAALPLPAKKRIEFPSELPATKRIGFPREAPSASPAPPEPKAVEGRARCASREEGRRCPGHRSRAVGDGRRGCDCPLAESPGCDPCPAPASKQPAAAASAPAGGR